jgi:hypothetical protein
MTKWIPFLFPILYLALILGLQPAGDLMDSRVAPELGRLVYDDYDMTAYALRGLNASLGRTAGRTDDPPYLGREQFNALLSEETSQTPLRDSYFLEYPHAALLIFRLGYWLAPLPEGVHPPAAVLDGSHRDLVEHRPENEREKLLWRGFRRVIRVYVVIMIGCLLALMGVLGRGYEAGGGWAVEREGKQMDRASWRAPPCTLLLLPAALYFSANRFDIVPALFMALALACLGRDRIVASALCLGVATVIKIYPGLVAILMIRYVSADRRKAATWTGAYVLTLLAFLLPTIWQLGWDATLAPYRFQLSRPMDGLSLYGTVLPSCLGENTLLGTVFRLGSVAATLAWLMWSRPVDLSGLLRRGAMILLVFVALQVFYSPQWIVWLLPLLVPLAAAQPSLKWTMAGLDLVTFATFPIVYDYAGSYQSELLTALVFLRAGCLLALAALLQIHVAVVPGVPICKTR